MVWYAEPFLPSGSPPPYNIRGDPRCRECGPRGILLLTTAARPLSLVAAGAFVIPVLVVAGKE
jgi:hypothetical protein